METLVNTQVQVGKEIEKISNAYNADRPDKKTLAYLKDKLNKLQDLWIKFEEGDCEIRGKYSAQTSHSYFTSGFYEKVRDNLDKVKKDIQQLITAVETHQKLVPYENNQPQKNDDTQAAQASTHKSADDEENLKLIKNQKRLISTLNNMLTNIQSMTCVQTKQFYTLKSESIKKYWNDIEKNNETIWGIIDDPSKYGYKLEDFINIQENYEDVLIKFANESETLDNPQQNEVNNFAAPSIQTIMKLPKMQLPKFDGSYIKWQQFYDLYVQMVHGQPLSNAQKMFYLKSNLSGEAERLIRHIPVSDDNYSSAWEILVTRYSNKRLLVSALIDRLLQQPAYNIESATSIKTMHDLTKECISGLENLGLKIYESWDPILLQILIRKLDRTTHTLYEQMLKSPRELQSLQKFLQFLELRFQSLEALGQKKMTNERKVTAHTVVKSNKLKCNFCSKEHAIYYCEQFLKLSPNERQSAVKKLNLCINCLKQGHKTSNCTSKNCIKCNGKHNSLLHITKEKASLSTSQEVNQPKEASSYIGATKHNEENTSSYVFLGTAVVTISDGQGNSIQCRALLDSGSQVNFITERMQKKSKLGKNHDNLKISRIGQTKLKISDKVNISLNSRITKYNTNLEAYVMKEITCCQPQQFVDIHNWNIPSNIELADSEFNKPAKIDLLIGAELYGEIMLNGQIKLNEKMPLLQNTTLGWIVLGKICSSRYSKPFIGVSNAELDDQLKKFWELEECTVELPMNSTDRRCEEFFMATTSRNKEGRFVVNMPIFSNTELLGNSRDMAYKRFLNMEKKLLKQPELYQQYKEFMKEYATLGHMSEVNIKKIPKIHYFLPHHYVLKPSSTTTKLRVVFDASAKTTTSLSLNDLMVAGPRIQEDLFNIILRFRMHKYVFSADIAQMYRQILLNEEDRNLQLIFWRDSPRDAMKCFQLSTVTYGTKAAPYLATRCLKQLADDESIRYPLASQVVKDFYVDDIITGHDSLAQALKIRNELDTMMQAGGFKLRKWCANHPTLLQGLPINDLSMHTDFSKNSGEHIKTLGLLWEPKQDCFMFFANWPKRDVVTKRTILADMSHLFDPLGLVNPVIVMGKIFMQQLWKLKYEWDEELPTELREKWVNFREGLASLNKLKIGRHAIFANAKKVELHAFADASEKAYGAAIYIRSTNNNDEIMVKLLCARSRVAPVKIVTLPRLELCAAKLASQLVQKLLKILHTKIDKINYWLDSQIALSWIYGDPTMFKTFVANRVQQIQEVSSPDQWRYVQTSLNPADLVSRGLTAHQLVVAEEWFRGPKFLQDAEIN